MISASAGSIRYSCVFRLVATAALAAASLVPAPAAAQIYTGRIDATVVDQTGGVLPGVTVDLTGQQTDSAVTDAQGDVHFLNLPVGKYSLKAALSGFGDYLKEDIYVGAGGAITLRVTMQVAAVGEKVEVVAQGTLIQPRKQLVATNLTADELQNVPSARDPWVLVQTVPGVVVDRVNVGGSESGQQSLFTAKGADFSENTWHLDGIPITDMNGTGSSPTYYDFEAFQEMQVTTGGADAQIPTPGVHLNLILKQGSDTPHGTARLFFGNESLQSNNLPEGLAAVAGPSGKGNRTDQYSDYGVEFGGPLQRQKWWVWGTVARTDVRIRTLNDVPDRTVLSNIGLKVNGQLNSTTRASFTYFRGKKTKNGRGAGPLNPPETTQDQEAPFNLYKGEASLIVGRSLFLTARAGFMTNRVSLEPKGGRETQVLVDANGVFHNSFYFLDSDRPQNTVLLDGNWFRGRHEMKFGMSWRSAKETDEFGWGGGVLNVELDPDEHVLLPIYYRPWSQLTSAHYFGSYIGDSITVGRLTAHLALRFDRTTNSALETRVQAHPLIPDVLPGFTAPAIDNAIIWNNFSPRIGAVYALDQARRTVVRGSYASFASQLGVQEAALASAATYAYVYYLSVDANQNGATENPEIVAGPLGAVGVDLSNPTSTQSVNRIDPSLASPRTQEFVVGLDHELRGNVLLSTSFTWRRTTNVLWSPFTDARQDDYVEDGRVSGSTPQTGAYDVAYYALKPSAVPPGGGIERVNRDGYHRRFAGLEAAVVKRLSNRWMTRIGFSMNDEREYFDDPAESISDPTPVPGNPLRDGGVVVRDAGASGGKGSFYLVAPRFQLSANGLWQGPWGLDFSGNLTSRQGFGKPYFVQVNSNDPLTPQKSVLVVDVNEERLSPVTILDARIEKAFSFSKNQLVFDVDVFNIANVSTPLKRQYRVGATGSAGFDNVLEIVSPRIVRLGIRVRF